MKPGDLIAANPTYFPANATFQTPGIVLRAQSGIGRIVTDFKLNQIGLVLATSDAFTFKGEGQFLLVAVNGVYGWVREKYVVLA